MVSRRRSPFVILWSSQGLSNVGDGLLVAAAPLLVASLTRDPLLVAGMTVVQFLPWLLFTLPSGALTDRLDRRRLLWVGNMLRGAGFLLLGTALMLDRADIWLVYLAVFVAGAAETLVDNAALTVPPRLLPRHRLEQANGQLAATQSVINSFVGPPLGSALFALGAALAFFTSAGAFALAGLVALFLPRLRPNTEEQTGERSGPAGVMSDIRRGWGYFWAHDLLRRVAFISAAINLTGAATGAVLVLLITGDYAVPQAWYGLFLAIPAVGAVLGALLAGRVLPALGGGPVTWLAALLPALSYAMLGLGTVPALAMATMLPAAMATAMNQVVVSTLRQAAVPDQLLGRVTAAYRLIVLGVVPVGALAGGLIGRWSSVPAVFVCAAVGLAGAAVLLAPRVTTRALRDAEVLEVEAPELTGPPREAGRH